MIIISFGVIAQGIFESGGIEKAYVINKEHSTYIGLMHLLRFKETKMVKKFLPPNLNVARKIEPYKKFIEMYADIVGVLTPHTYRLVIRYGPSTQYAESA